MRAMHRFLSTVPFDLYELALFHLVVKHRSFTKAAEIAGLTQSAITRQMQGVENSLGIQLLERTNRCIISPRNSPVRERKSVWMCRGRLVWHICPASFTQICGASRRSAIG